jgi:D-alanyl-D-alanine carboxypeptidase/D-alanyl-D-alanine-endopeptidase (penicillin-binding protein 4)
MHRSRTFILAMACLAPLLTAASVRPAVAAGRDPTPTHVAAPAPRWTRQIDKLIGRRSFGVAVREGTQFLYRHDHVHRRIPASNEKLLLTMSILDALGPEARLITQAASEAPAAGVVPGDLWILGQGDPALGASRMERLADAIQAAGVLQIEGSVMGSTGYFKRDWRAPGWKRYFPREHIPLPTALTFEGNTAGGVHIRDPELRAAVALSKALKERGIRVRGKAGSGKAPHGLLPVAQIESRPLADLLEYTNRYSSNFYAEVLGKRLGAEHAGVPGSISKGATAISSWAAEQGVSLTARDSSGLSYANRVSPQGLVKLLGAAELQTWGEAMREALPRPGQGTLEGRMKHLQVHAKTGTLTAVSSLSGWVFLRRSGVWAEFSILSRGVPKDHAMRVEDAIVRILARSATI